MLFIILDWIYVFFVTFALGYAFSCFSGKALGYRLRTLDGILMAGVVCATFYAQAFSLFYRVSLLANVILVLFSILTFILGRKQIAALFRGWRQSASAAVKVLVIVLFLFWAYASSRGYMVFDTELYHGAAIRWIEEYGVVPGQGILNQRFSYNSSIFSLTALFSLKYIFGQSLHACDGWIAFILSLTVLGMRKGLRKFRLSDFACVAAIYYLTLIFDEVVSPSSDYASMCTIFFLVIHWIRMVEAPKEEQNTAAFGLLCVLGVHALTLKLTAGLVLILTLKPAIELLREKKWKQIGVFLGMGLLLAIPWMARSVLISGWLIYPLAAIDLFDVPWKQSKQSLLSDAGEIKLWARGVYYEMTAKEPIWEWYGIWLGTLTLMQKAFAFLDVLALFATFFSVTIPKIRKRWFSWDYALLVAMVGCCYLYWQLSAPMPRYGYAYMLLFPAVVFGGAVLLVGKDFLVRLGFGAYGIYKLLVILLAIKATMGDASTYIRQDDYTVTEFPVQVETIDGVDFYRTDSESLGYAYFPGDQSIYEFELIGTDLSDGFRWKTEE